MTQITATMRLSTRMVQSYLKLASGVIFIYKYIMVRKVNCIIIALKYMQLKPGFSHLPLDRQLQFQVKSVREPMGWNINNNLIAQSPK